MQEEIEKYRKEISEKDSQITVLKHIEKTNKDLLVKIAEVKLKKEGKSITNVVRKYKRMLCNMYICT